MDKALKQRLVGASVLIALAVVVLPMLLNGGKPGGEQQSQKIELPPRPDELAFETRRFPLQEQTNSPASDGDGGVTQRLGHQKTDEKDELPVPGRLTAPTSDPELPAAEGVVDAAALADVEAQVPANGDEVSVAVVTPLAAPEEITESVPTTVENAAPKEVAHSPAGQYVVQVASLGSSNNASRLVSALKKKNFPVLLDNIESDVGKLSRVRVGPYASEVEATAASARIGVTVEGVNPRVINLSPEQRAQVSSPVDSLVRWVVQAGSFTESANAERLVQNLKQQGLGAYQETITASGSSVYRVRLGPFLERDEAKRVKQKLSDDFSINGVVMSAD